MSTRTLRVGERKPMRGASGQALVCLPPSNIHMLTSCGVGFQSHWRTPAPGIPPVRPTCSAPRDRLDLSLLLLLKKAFWILCFFIFFYNPLCNESRVINRLHHVLFSCSSSFSSACFATFWTSLEKRPNRIYGLLTRVHPPRT